MFSARASGAYANYAEGAYLADLFALVGLISSLDCKSKVLGTKHATCNYCQQVSYFLT